MRLRRETGLWFGYFSNTGHGKQNGFLLLEYIVWIGLVGLFFSVMLPKTVWNPKQYEVDMMARKIAVHMQCMRQHSLTNGTADADSWVLSIRKDRYVIMQRYIVHKTRMYPNSISISVGQGGRKDFAFNGQGRPKHDMEITISHSQMPEYTKKIIVAAQTGRIRIE